MNKIISVLFLLIYSTCSAGEEIIISERPGQALSPFCLPAKSFQVQSGVNFYNKSGLGMVHSTAVRFGLGNLFEVNSSLDIELDERSVSIPSMGLKMNLFTSQRSSYSLQYNTHLNIAFEKSRKNNLTMITTHSLSKRSGFSTNFGVSYEENLEAYFVLNYSQNVLSDLTVLVEYYGRGQNSIEHFYDVGLGWLVTNKLQLDLYSGTSFLRRKEDFFINVGFSYRLDL